MYAARRIAAVLVGFVFFMAGILKLMDPVGNGLVVAEYYKFLHLGMIGPTAPFAGSFLALAETITGVALITGVWRRLTAVVSGAMLFVFTLLTVALVVFNPSMECGCFGEAVHLSHTQSLVKNLVLCVLWVFAFVPVRKLGNRKIKFVSFAVASLSCCVFFVHSLLSVPLMDFTPFAPGCELAQENEEYASDAPLLSFCNESGEYADSIATVGRVIISSVYDADRFNESGWNRLAAFFDMAEKAGYRPLLLVSAVPGNFRCAVDGDRCYFADRKTLMTLNRSNGGVTLISDGQVVRKWAFNFLPSEKGLSSDSPKHLMFQGFLLYVFAVMLLL